MGNSVLSGGRIGTSPMFAAIRSAQVKFQVIGPEARPSDRLFPFRVERIAPALRDHGLEAPLGRQPTAIASVGSNNPVASPAR